MRALAFTLLLLASVPTARADVVDDGSCHAWEHWQGGHSGECRFGPRCSMAPGRHDAPHVLAGVVGAAFLARRRGRK